MIPDHQAVLDWLDEALWYAFELRRPELWAYLEAVMEEVLFEVEQVDLAAGGSVVAASARGWSAGRRRRPGPAGIY